MLEALGGVLAGPAAQQGVLSPQVLSEAKKGLGPGRGWGPFTIRFTNIHGKF